MGMSDMVALNIGAIDTLPKQAAFMAGPASPVTRQGSPPGAQNVRSSLVEMIQ
jgi:hypothetical protein